MGKRGEGRKEGVGRWAGAAAGVSGEGMRWHCVASGTASTWVTSGVRGHHSQPCTPTPIAGLDEPQLLVIEHH